MKKAKTKEKTARNVALRYLSYRDRSSDEVKKHLEKKNFLYEEIEDTLAFLLEYNFIDDRDYCERYIRSCIEKGRGPLRIERELLSKGIDIETISNKLEAEYSDERERELAFKYVRKVLGRNEIQCWQSCEEEPEIQLEEKDIARVARRLNAQGYNADVIYEIVGRLLRNL